MSTITTRAAIARAPHVGWEIVDLRLEPPKAHEVRVKLSRAWRVPHSAFHDKTARATQPRHSIEFRSVAYFE